MYGLGKWRSTFGMGTSNCNLDLEKSSKESVYSHRRGKATDIFLLPTDLKLTKYLYRHLDPGFVLRTWVQTREEWGLLNMLTKSIGLYVYTWYQDFQWGDPLLPVSWWWCCSSLSEKGGVLGLCLLSLCSPCPWSLPYTASLQWSPAFCEDFGESRSWCRDCFPQLQVRWLSLAFQSSHSVLKNTSPLILGSGGLRSFSWLGCFLSCCSLVIWASSLTLPQLEEDRDLSGEQCFSNSSKFSSGCLGFSFFCFTVFPSLCSLQDLEYPEPNSLALLDLGWSEWRYRDMKNKNAN